MVNNMKIAPAENKAVTSRGVTRRAPFAQMENEKMIEHQSLNDKNDKKEMRAQLKSIPSSFQDLVLYNDQGQPSIDINRLVYKPKKVKHSKEKEKLSWYFPDYIFIIFNFLCLTFSSYFFLNGLTIISWRNSMETFVLRNCSKTCSCGSEMNEEICRTIEKEYGFSRDVIPYSILRFYGLNDVNNYGLGLLGFGLCNILNIIIGISACLDGNKSLLIFHLVFDVILFVFEVGLVLLLHLTGRCDERDIKIIKLFLERHVKNYGKDEPDELVKKDTTELDLIQISLTCCGVGNWTDFLPRSTWENGDLIERAVIERYNSDKSALIIPSTCCRRWWIRNIYCAHEAHTWAYPTASELQTHQFRERISPWGCLPKMVALCRNMLAMAGVGGLVACALHFCLSIVRHICAFTQIQTINTLIRERKRIFRRKETYFGGNEAAVEDEKDMFPSLSTLFEMFSESSEVGIPPSHNMTSQIPFPPKEKEIANMKSRQDFNRMQTSMRSTHVDDWIHTGRAFVEGRKIPSKKSNIKVEESLMRNRKKDLVRQEELPNMQHASVDHQSEIGMPHGRKEATVEKDHDDVNAFDALKLIQHVKRE